MNVYFPLQTCIIFQTYISWLNVILARGLNDIHWLLLGDIRMPNQSTAQIGIREMKEFRTNT